MYFWRIDELKKDLVAKPLTDREVLPYLLIYVAMTAVVPLFPVEAMNGWDYAAAGWTLLVAVLGTLYVYRCNGAAAGTQFVQRYLSIGWVVVVRWGVVAFAVFLALLFFVDTPENGTGPAIALFWMIAELVLYERMGHHIRSVVVAASRSNSTVESDAKVPPF